MGSSVTAEVLVAAADGGVRVSVSLLDADENIVHRAGRVVDDFREASAEVQRVTDALGILGIEARVVGNDEDAS